MQPSIIGFICCYNEVDIIEEVLRFYQRAQVPVVFIDNGSTDGTAEIAKRYVGTEVLEYVRYETETYDLKELLDLCLATVEHHTPDWIMHIDADHLYEPSPGYASFHDQVNDAENRQCNVIDFDEYVFLPTMADESNNHQMYERMKYYAFRGDVIANYPNELGPFLRQPRLYRYQAGMNISDDGGHTIFYPNDKMRAHPVRGILRHYMFRSLAQARRKLEERRARYSAAGRARGWHTQYDNWAESDETFLRDPSTLIRRVEGTAWSKEVVLLEDGSLEGPRSLLSSREGDGRNAAGVAQHNVNVIPAD